MCYVLINLTLLFIVCSKCSMVRPGYFMELNDLTTSLIPCVTNFFGCELLNVLTLYCAFWSTKLFMVLHRITLPKCVCQLVLLKLADIACIRQPSSYVLLF